MNFNLGLFCHSPQIIKLTPIEETQASKVISTIEVVGYIL